MPFVDRFRRSRLMFECLEARNLLTSIFLEESFPGIPDTNSQPPDPVGAAGPANLLAVVNSRISLFSKSGTLLETADLDVFSEGKRGFFGEIDANFGSFDPYLFYDRYSERYIVVAEEVEFGSNGQRGGPGADEAYLLIGVSTSSTPDDLDVVPGDTDNDWHVYQLPATADFGTGLAWIDYPKIVADADGIFITGNYFGFGGSRPFRGSQVIRLDKEPLLNGTLGEIVERPVVNGAGLFPAQSISRDSDDPQLFAERLPSGIRIWQMNDAGPLEVAATLAAPNGEFFGGAPQPGTGSTLDTLSPRMISALWRDDALWTTHTVSVDGDATVRWYQIDTTDSFQLTQQGDINPGVGIHTYLPALAVDSLGNMGITYTQSSTNQFPTMMITGREADDPLGFTAPGVVVRASDTSYLPGTTGVRRWGDYAGMSVDPLDDRTFWAYHQFAATPQTWGTQWGGFRVESTFPDVGDTLTTSLDLALPLAGGSSTVVEQLGNGQFGQRDVDLYQFAAEAEAVLLAETLLPISGEPVDTILRLFDATGSELVFDDNGGSDAYAAITATLPDTGTYYLGVSGSPNAGYNPTLEESGVSGAIGDYRLEVTVNPLRLDVGDSLDTSLDTAIRFAEGSFIRPREALGNGPFADRDVDLYRLEGPLGATLSVETFLPQDGVGADTVLRLFDANGEELAFSDDIDTNNGNFFSRIVYTFDRSGTYYLGVSGFGNDIYDPVVAGSGFPGGVGDYGLQILLRDIPDLGDTLMTSKDTGIGMAGGTYTVREVVGNGPFFDFDVDIVQLTALAGAIVTAETSAVEGGAPADTILRLFDASGTELARDDEGGQDNFSRLTFTLPETGIYYVGVSAFPNLTYDPTVGGSGEFGFLGDYQLDLVTESPSFQVVGISPKPSGVQVTLNRPVDASQLNLVDAVAALGPPDLSLVGSGPDGQLGTADDVGVAGTLVIDASETQLTLVQTGGLLPEGAYALTLRSAANAFQDQAGMLLDGDQDGIAGGDFTTMFTVQPVAPGTVVVGLPDFARGAGQTVQVPATETGLPIQLSDGSGITHVQLTLSFDPDRLSIDGIELGEGVPGGSSAELRVTSSGIAELTFSAPSPLPTGEINLVYFRATVPDTAPYPSKQVLILSEVVVNDGAIPVQVDASVHVTAYFGDTTGDGLLTVSDVVETLQLAAGQTAGFLSYQLADPLLLADIDDSGSVTVSDVSLQLAASAGSPVSSIPALPGLTELPTPEGPDPKLSLPRDITVFPGTSVVVPLQLEITEPSGAAFDAGTVVLTYDPQVFTLASVEIDAFLHQVGFRTLVHAEVPGQIVLSFVSLEAVSLPFGFMTDLLRFTLAVAPAAAADRLALNLMAVHEGITTGLFHRGEGLILLPAPTNASDDPIDGLIRVIVPQPPEAYTRPQPQLGWVWIPLQEPKRQEMHSIVEPEREQAEEFEASIPLRVQKPTSIFFWQQDTSKIDTNLEAIPDELDVRCLEMKV